jgi:hypothetical protein
MLHACPAIDGAAAGGNHMATQIKTKENLLLQATKPIRPMPVHEFLEGLLLIGLDHCVDIDKTVGQACGKQGAHRAFPGTGHPDQNQIHFSRRHDKMVHQWRRKDNQTQWTYKAGIAIKP